MRFAANIAVEQEVIVVAITIAFLIQGVHKVLHTLKIFISQKPHKVETLHFRQ